MVDAIGEGKVKRTTKSEVSGYRFNSNFQKGIGYMMKGYGERSTEVGITESFSKNQCCCDESNCSFRSVTFLDSKI